MITTRGSVIFLLFLCVASSQNIESDSHIPWTSEEDSTMWMEYELNTGAGNRQELVVTNISIHTLSNVPSAEINWRYLNSKDGSFLLRADKSTLYLYNFNLETAEIEDPVQLNVEGTILIFRAVEIRPKVNIVAVLCIEISGGIWLRWYKLVDEKSFQLFWRWPIQRRIRDMKFIEHDGTNKLLLLNEEEIHFGLVHSPIDVYGFSIDFSTNAFQFWLCQRTLMPKAINIQVCSIYENIYLAIQSADDVFLYDYRNTTQGSMFRDFQTIKSHNLKNFVCFESGYLQFFAVSGPEAALFHYQDNEFKFNTASESCFDFSDIVWVKDIKVNTFRDESLLLVQLKNSTTMVLGWQGLSFKKIELPNDVLNRFDLSTVTVLPKFGFVSGNQFVKFHTELRDVKHPVQYTMERLLALQQLLNDSLNRQNEVLDQAKISLEKSYLENPNVTGVWNISTVNVTNAIIFDNVTFHSVTVGSVNLTKEELKLDPNDLEERLNEIKRKLDEIDTNLRNVANFSSPELRFDGDIEISGNIKIAGNLNVTKLRVSNLNGIDVTQKSNGNNEYDAIRDQDIFDSIDAENITIRSLNGIPIENIRFSNFRKNYDNVDFSAINHVHIDGHIFFSTINGVDWEELMSNIVWKNKPMFIPGETIVEGVVTADNVEFNTLNDLLYPEDYVITDSDSTAIVGGNKSFDLLVASQLESVGTLNGIDFDDFVQLNRNNILKEEITFENLIVEDLLQVDGEITGVDATPNKLLNESSVISSDVSFLNLEVYGNVTFNTLFMNKRPLDLTDLLLKNEEDVEITGMKTFLGNVEIKSNVTITSGMVNGHYLDEFVTIDTDQTFPNLIKILPNVTFGNVSYGVMDKLSNGKKDPSDCIEKIIVFESPITVDKLSFGKLNGNITQEYFNQKLNETFQNIEFENLIVDTLVADQIAPKFVNGRDFENFTEHLKLSSTVNEFTVNNLEVDVLNASTINGMSLNEINEMLKNISSTLDLIRNGNFTLDTLKVTGMIKTDFVNGERLIDLYKGHPTKSIIFKEEVSVKRLKILGLLNGYNFTEGVADTVLKTDTNIVIDAYKIFDHVYCHILNATHLNGNPIENILDPFKEQVLTGPVNIDGAVTISKQLNVSGKIGHIPFQDFTNRFKSLGNNTFVYNGHVQFPNNVTIKNLYVNGSIQGRDWNSFLESTIDKNEDNVTISGAKVFQNTVVFNDSLEIHDKLNDIDLRRFREKCVWINDTFAVKSKIIFKDGIEVKAELAVVTNLETESIMNVDMNELKFNVLYLNRPTHIEDTATFTNVTFESDIEVGTFNDVDMKLLIPLDTEQIISVEPFKGRNVTAEKLTILGLVNGKDVQEIKRTTFMMSGNQNITGHFDFLGNVNFRRNFNPRLLNGIDPRNFIPLDTKDPIVGNLQFENTVYFNESLRVLKYLNGIDPVRWEAVAVTANNSYPQIISGAWRVFGNVYFKNGAIGSSTLNGTNITELASVLEKEHLEMETILAEKDENLDSLCDDLTRLQRYAEKQIYQFSAFDYLQVIDFNDSISSVHHFELDDEDYLLLSFNSCTVYTFVFDGINFKLVAKVPNFGIVEKWTTFRQNRTLYFLTTGPNSCDRSPVNLWMLKNDSFQHMLDLGRDVDGEKINRNPLLMLLDKRNRMRNAGGINDEVARSLSSLAESDDVKIVLEKDEMLLTSKPKMYKYDVDRSNSSSSGKNFEKPVVLNFKAGLLEKEMILYYDRAVSTDHIFICNNEATQTKVLQTIKTHRPSFFTVLNFEGSIQTLLVFVENKKYLHIYEYRGIQGFVYTDRIKMNVDKLVSFKFRRYTNSAKRYCLALIQDNTLSLLEAKMHGEKLDIGTLSCSKHEEQ